MYHFISAVQRQSAIAFKEWLRRIDLLLIDDMQFLQGKSATEFGHNLSALLSGAKQVVVAGDAPPRDLDMIDERVRSRLSGGLVVPIITFDYDLRRAIVARRAELAVQRFPGRAFPRRGHRFHRPCRGQPWPRPRRRRQPAGGGQPADQRGDHRPDGGTHPGRPDACPRGQAGPHRGYPQARLAPLQGAAQRPVVFAPLARSGAPAPDRHVSGQVADLALAARDWPALWRPRSHHRPALGPQGRTVDEGRRRPAAGSRTAQKRMLEE